MKTAIIVLNYNDFSNTQSFIKKIQKYSILDKIIVVDNVSTDNSYQELLHLQNEKVEVIQSDKNGGYAYGNNYGIRYLENKEKDSYETILISNPDVEIEEETIVQCLEELKQNPKIAIVAPRMYWENGKPARRSSWKKRTYWIDIANSSRFTQIFLFPLFKKGEYSKKDYQKQKLKVDTIAGSFFCIKLNILKEIGYLDENTFLFYEEDILAEKLRKKNYEIYSLNYLKFIHYDSVTIKKSFNAIKKIEQLGESKKYYHQTYHKIGKTKLNFLNFIIQLRKWEARYLHI